MRVVRGTWERHLERMMNKRQGAGAGQCLADSRRMKSSRREWREGAARSEWHTVADPPTLRAPIRRQDTRSRLPHLRSAPRQREIKTYKCFTRIRHVQHPINRIRAQVSHSSSYPARTNNRAIYPTEACHADPQCHHKLPLPAPQRPRCAKMHSHRRAGRRQVFD